MRQRRLELGGRYLAPLSFLICRRRRRRRFQEVEKGKKKKTIAIANHFHLHMKISLMWSAANPLPL